MQQHGSKYLAHRPPPNPGTGVKRSNSTFLEHGHVAYQIKGNHECSSMVANNLPADPPKTLGDGDNRSKFNFFSENGLVAYKIKGNHECSDMVANIKLADTPPPPPGPGGWGQQVKFQLFQNMVKLHIKLKGITKCSSMVSTILPADLYTHHTTLTLWVGSKL